MLPEIKKNLVKVPVNRRLDFEGNMESTLETLKKRFGDTPEMRRRLFIVAQGDALDFATVEGREVRKMTALRQLAVASYGRTAAAEEPGEELEIAEVVAKIDENLTEDERKMAHLFREELDIRQVAERLEIPEETVRDQWKTLQTKMRRLMERFS